MSSSLDGSGKPGTPAASIATSRQTAQAVTDVIGRTSTDQVIESGGVRRYLEDKCGDDLTRIKSAIQCSSAKGSSGTPPDLLPGFRKRPNSSGPPLEQEPSQLQRRVARLRRQHTSGPRRDRERAAVAVMDLQGPLMDLSFDQVHQPKFMNSWRLRLGDGPDGPFSTRPDFFRVWPRGKGRFVAGGAAGTSDKTAGRP
jgi:hypothetical protein